MASENNEPDLDSGAGEALGRTESKPKIVWDGANMQPVYANATDVAGGPDEIVILFGTSQRGQDGEDEIEVQLSARIVLSLATAKRLSLTLSAVIRDYEREFGGLHIASGQNGSAVQ